MQFPPNYIPLNQSTWKIIFLKSLKVFQEITLIYLISGIGQKIDGKMEIKEGGVGKMGQWGKMVHLKFFRNFTKDNISHPGYY